jgi:3',5'-cyclic AMP phosphodiesterase CpdA
VYIYRVSDRANDVATPEAVLRTADADKDTFTFSHLSDSQAGSAEFGKVMDAVLDSSDFVVHTGDVVHNAQYEYEWSEMLDEIYEKVMGMPIMAITGNHETTFAGCNYEPDKHFNNNVPTQGSTANGYYYSFVYGDVKFIMLNTNDLSENKLKTEQYNWLISELESNTCRWIIVAMHNPMYSVGKYGSNETKNSIALALRDQLGGVFHEYGVDLVLEGHDHTVSRTYPIDGDGVARAETLIQENGISYVADPDGVIYAMNGTSGIQQRTPEEVYEDVYAFAEASKKASWADITVTDDTLTVTVKWIDNIGEHVYYSWGIKKS